MVIAPKFMVNVRCGHKYYFFRDLAYVAIAAITGGLIAWRLRQPVIIGYVLAGIVISPLTPGPSVSDIYSLERFAEIGVVLLMFSVGLEFSLKELLKAKWVAFIGAPLGMCCSILMASGAGSLIGWTLSQRIALGAVISVASTMVLTRLLVDQGQLRTTAGHIMVAIALVEDLAVVVLIVLIPGFANLEKDRLLTLARDFGRAALILAPVLFLAAKIIPPLLKRVARTQSRELFFLVVLAICLGTATLTNAIGLSLALGAFAAGLIISESDYAHEAIAQLFPLRDASVAVFFVSIGLLIDPRTLFSDLTLLGIMVALIVVGNFVVWTGVVRLFGYSWWTAVPVGVGLTQIGEFSFVMVQVARKAGIVGNEMYNATLAASLVTILINSALTRSLPNALARIRLSRKLSALPQKSEEPAGMHGHVVICGFGRVGSEIGYALATFGVRYVAIEIDPDVIETLQSRDISSIFGDCSHSHILERANIQSSSLLIVTVPDRDRARLAITNARKMNQNLPIMARAHRREEYPFLMEAGATEVIQPEAEASATFIRHACGHYLMLPDPQIRVYLREFRDAMESANRTVRPPQIVPEVREVAVYNAQYYGRSLREMKLREKFGVTVVSIRRTSGESVINPPADTILQLNDRLRVLGRSDEIEIFEAQLSARGSDDHSGSTVHE
jgi:CPA2 family monovalent cation:H+ antiporter-2